MVKSAKEGVPPRHVETGIYLVVEEHQGGPVLDLTPESLVRLARAIIAGAGIALIVPDDAVISTKLQLVSDVIERCDPCDPDAMEAALSRALHLGRRPPDC